MRLKTNRNHLGLYLCYCLRESFACFHSVCPVTQQENLAVAAKLTGDGYGMETGQPFDRPCSLFLSHIPSHTFITLPQTRIQTLPKRPSQSLYHTLSHRITYRYPPTDLHRPSYKPSHISSYTPPQRVSYTLHTQPHTPSHMPSHKPSLTPLSLIHI